MQFDKYPGNGYYYVICDACDSKYRAKDTMRISKNDKYNPWKGMIVCKGCSLAAKTNPQAYLKSKRERPLRNPTYVRPEQEDTYLTFAAGTVPQSEVRYLKVYDYSSSYVQLLWQPALDSGQAPVSGYKIERESPVGGGFATLTNNTGTAAEWYEDDTVTASTQYNYRVTPLNSNGVGVKTATVSITTKAS